MKNETAIQGSNLKDFSVNSWRTFVVLCQIVTFDERVALLKAYFAYNQSYQYFTQLFRPLKFPNIYVPGNITFVRQEVLVTQMQTPFHLKLMRFWWTH